MYDEFKIEDIKVKTIIKVIRVVLVERFEEVLETEVFFTLSKNWYLSNAPPFLKVRLNIIN